MLPKIIHYCWFGGKPLPKSAIKCKESWKKFLPEYEIKEWNESNFDVNSIPYTRDAYAAKKYAFVSDYARFYILYHEGGLYFDTDVEIIRPMNDIIEKGAFMSVEIPFRKLTQAPSINPGQGIGASKGHPVYKEMIDFYQKLSFYREDGAIQNYAMIRKISDIFSDAGMKAIDEVQLLRDTYIYPADYFNPLDELTGKLNITDRTKAIHWYEASWLPSQPIWRKKLKQIIRRILKVKKQ